jgi:chromosome segregation ATPase
MWFALAVLLSSCASPPGPSSARPQAQQPRQPPTGDELFAAGQYAEAIATYQRELERGERVAELQTSILLARSALSTPGTQLIDELRAIERAYPRSRWGHLAGILATEIDRGTVLRQAVMAAGADLRAANETIETQKQRITALTTQAAEQQTTLATLRDERTRLQAQVRELEERGASQEARLKELEAELLALKKVDMERRP